ncbi:KH type 1 domain protein [Nanobdella aerobiophila]|uniref:KH type 1 domain protein n=1 Tax=Nanobdella aerobiophila TaxID=2586965 RepID=A0A915SFR0_9ARCH|nr:KH domain-containing protein [Nanobdella aerobiophila]BBL45569.1 KH type 1 domain protein [Nanobdella aerobiophila]
MYIYEFELGNINKNKLKEFLENKGIKYHIDKNKMKVFLEDFYFGYRFDKFIKSIEAGFNIELSSNILYNNWDILYIDLKQVFEKKENHIIRIEGRIIGEDGKAIREIMNKTASNIIIDDRYIYLLGDSISIQAAYEAIKRLVNGQKHDHVYEFLNKYVKNLKNKEIEIYKYTKQ